MQIVRPDISASARPKVFRLGCHIRGPPDPVVFVRRVHDFACDVSGVALIAEVLWNELGIFQPRNGSKGRVIMMIARR